MNIAQAKQIPLQRLVEQLGGTFSHKGRAGELWFFSPFRPDERTASFKIDEPTNKWHDFARTNKVDAHGDIIDLWTDYNNLPRRTSDAIKEALKALSDEFGSIAPSTTRLYVPKEKQGPPVKKIPRYKLLKSPGKIWLDSLKAEVGRRNLTLQLVQPYLKQAFIEDTKSKKQYNCFAFMNDKQGWEISIPNPHKEQSFKNVIGPKAITTIDNNFNRNVCVFEGFWDCFTYMAMSKNKDHLPTLYALNSTSMIYEVANKLITNKNNIEKVFLFLDNDNAGLKAQTQLLDLLEPHNMSVGTSNQIYKGYKDLSAYWMKYNLSPSTY